MNKIYKTIDLFAGIGGIRKGYELTGRFTNVLSSEIDKYACQAYEYLYGENPFNDVTTKEFKELVKNTDYDVLLAGFPCQAFSIAGLKEGFEDETRGTLFFDIAKIIELTNPKAFMLENVEGLLKHDKGKTFHIIAKTLDELGYHVVGVDTHTSAGKKRYFAQKENIVRTPYNFGIPQKRARVFIMGFRKKDIPDGYIFPPLPNKKELSIYNNLNDLLEENVASNFYLSQQYLDTLNKHKSRHTSKKSGFGYIVVNDEENPIANTIMATGGSGKERNLIRQYRPEYVGLTDVKGKKGALNNKGIRYMTPNEWGKLQGFINYAFIENGTDKFDLPASISNTQKYKLFGNSVCIPVIESMAEYMVERLDEIYKKEENKMKFNKGEWSELYTILYLLNHNRLEIADSQLQPLTKDIFIVKNIFLKNDDSLKFSIENNETFKFHSKDKTTTITRDELESISKILLSNIKSKEKSRAFEIKDVTEWLEHHNIKGIKGKSTSKADIFLDNFDNILNDTYKIGYSIKSKLGQPATILNASKQTNFKYIVSGLEKKDIIEINSIDSKKKLKERIKTIQEKGGEIKFDQITSTTFKENLEHIDMSLPTALGEILLNSYKDDEKNLKTLFENSPIYPRRELAITKLENFLLAISFGMRPSEKWEGEYEANGGILIVNKDSNIYTLDMIYHPKEVKQFLVSQTKLDSPDPNRYNILILKEENGEIYFNLNLQIRYK